MCRSTVDIQSTTAEIRRGKKKKKQDQNIMSASATQGGHNEGPKQLKLGHISDLDLKGHLVRSAMFHKNDLCCFSV